MSDEFLCEVCGKEAAVGVASVPMVPMSVAYGLACLRANAHPWDILAINTAVLGGLAHTNEAWRAMVEDTCKHLGRSQEEFETAVSELSKQVDSGS